MAGIMQNIAYNIRRIRRAHDWSQEDLAVHLGVDKSTIGRWEQAKSWIQPEHIDAIAEAFGIKPSHLCMEPEGPTIDHDRMEELIKILMRK